MTTYKNRYGDIYYYEPLGDNRYKFVLEGTSMNYCRFGGKEGQEHIDDNDLGMFDPSGGPYTAVGERCEVGVVKSIKLVAGAIIIEVER